MKRSAARLLCAVGVLVLMACVAFALSSEDSLVTLSYLKNTFFPSAVETGAAAANAKLQETYDNAKGTLDDFQKGYLAGGASGVLYSTSLQARNWNEGAAVELPTGGGVLMLAGRVTVSHRGAVIDVTAGTEVASGSQLIANHRYLVGEDTTAQMTVLSGAAQMGVQGSYQVTDEGTKTTPFYDVCRTDWYYAPVNYVYENSLFSGMDENHFEPGSVMNRAMLMTVLYRMADSPVSQLQSASVSFADVPESAWYASYVKWGAAQGITAGTGANTFSPEKQVTRQQVVVLLYSFAGNYLGLNLADGADLSGYQDLSETSDWARKALSWAVAEGIISSSSADALTLSPQKSANRAEVATMLRVFSEKIL
ncbi:MAG: S-layer homology domain-containing protein [Lawsonibacter sp.]|nr:S-layer homology domain-containing protein [Lawsonibacter sp.]